MLSAGSYSEGEVVAGVLSSGSSVSADALLAESKEVIDVVASDAESTPGPAVMNDRIDIVYIQRADMTTEEILYRLARTPGVVFAEPNYLMDSEAASDEKPAEEPNSEPASDEEHSYSVRLSDITDLTAQQWSSWDSSDFIIEGQDGYSIHVPNFDTQTGNMDGDPVVVAVMDDPIDFTHPDLAQAAYTFTEEQQQILGCDVHGFNATSESLDGILKYYPDMIHGTHCAGIIASAWDGHGISGIASNVKLVSIQNLTDDDKTSLVNALRGFDFIDRANELGCGISLVSNSWSLMQGSRALDAAIRNLGEKWGVLCIFASGNESMDHAGIGDDTGTLYDNPYVISVAAMDSAGKVAPYSNYGHDFVDVGAPGSGILSTINTETKHLQYFTSLRQIRLQIITDS